MALSRCLLIPRCCCSNAPTGPLVVSSSLSVNYYKKEYKEASRPVEPSRATEISMGMIQTGVYKHKHVSSRRTYKCTNGGKTHTHLLNSFQRHCINGYVWVACQLAICFSHIQFSFPRRVPPNLPQRLIRKSRLACDKLMAQTVYLNLLEIISRMELFLDITGKDNEDILLSSLIPLRAWCYVKYCAAAEKCMQLAGACTAKAETTANRALRCLSLKGLKCQLWQMCSGRTGSETQCG